MGVQGVVATHPLQKSNQKQQIKQTNVPKKQANIKKKRTICLWWG